MDDDLPNDKPDLALAAIGKQDISYLSVEDLKERIANMTMEIERCEKAIEARGDTRAAADQLFKL